MSACKTETSGEGPAAADVCTRVTREVLEKVFGPSLLAAIQAAFEQEQSLSAQAKQLARSKAKSRAGGGSGGGSEGGVGRGDGDSEQKRGDEDDNILLVDQLTGDDKAPGKLQV